MADGVGRCPGQGLLRARAVGPASLVRQSPRGCWTLEVSPDMTTRTGIFKRLFFFLKKNFPSSTVLTSPFFGN